MTYIDYQTALDQRFESYDPELRAKVRKEWEAWVEENVLPQFQTSVKNMPMWQRYNGLSPAMRYYRAHFGSEVSFI